jgi:phosphatidylglycerophosphatase C
MSGAAPSAGRPATMAAVPAPSDSRPVVAAFDVDGTLTRDDCVVPFLRRVAGAPRVALGLLVRCGPVVAALARRDRDRFKELATHAAFAGRPVAAVEQAGTELAADIERSGLRPDTAARLAWHRGAGHATVLVSASYGAYLRPLAAAIGVDGVVASELEVAADGRCTGMLVDGNCRGPEKVRRLHDWLAAHHGGRHGVVLWAYGDSDGDRELLADADHPVWAQDVVLTAAPEGSA